MKSSLHSLPPFVSRATLLATSFGLAVVAHANEITKLDNAMTLSDPLSWSGGNAPGTGDVAVWDAAVSVDNTTSSLGADQSWAGIRVIAPAGAVTINAGNTLTLGASGIDLSSAAQNLTLSNPITLGATQTWNVATGRTLTATGVLTGAGLVKAGLGTVVLSGASTAWSSGLAISAGTVEGTTYGALGSGTVTLGDTNTGTNNLTLYQKAAGNSAATNIVVAADGTGLAKLVFNQDWWGTTGKTYNTANDWTLTLNRMVNFQCGASGKQIAPFVTGSGVAAGNPAVKIDGGTQVTWTAAMNSTNTAVQVNNFTGNVWVTGNTKLQMQNRAYQSATTPFYNGVIPDTATLIVDPGSTYQMHHGAETIGFLSGGGSMLVGTGTSGNQLTIAGDATTPSTSPSTLGTATFSGTFSTNQSALIKNGTGTQEFSGTGITFTAGVNLNNGTLKLSNTSNWGSAITLANTDTPTLKVNAAGAGDSWTFNKQINGGSTAAKIEKVGPGTVILSPAASSTFVGSASGALTATEGKLVLNSTGFGTAPAVSVASGATFGGTATTGAITAAAGGIVQGGHNGAGTLTPASLTFSGTGTVSGALSASTTPLVVSGALTTSGGANSINVSLAGGVPANGTYHLIQFGSYAGNIGNFKFASPVRAMSLQQNGNFIDVAVNAANYPVWTGGGSGNWSSNSGSGNWKLSSDSSSTDFLALDNALFDDNATGTTDIVVGLTDVSAGVMTFSNSTKDYTLTQQNGKDITSGSLVKNGTGKLTIDGAFTFSGGSTINAGTVSINNETSLGTGNRTLNGGTLEYTGGSATWTRGTTVGAAGGTLSITDPAAVVTHNGAFSSTGTLTKAGDGTLALSLGAGTLAAPFNISAGTLNLNYGGNAVTYSGNITGTAGVLRLDGTGASATTGFTITGNNTFSGETHVYGRRIFLNSATPNGALTGNVVIKSGAWPFHGISLSAPDQVADAAVLRFEQTNAPYNFLLNGKNETLAGIESLGGTTQGDPGAPGNWAIVSNAGYDGSNDANGMAAGNLTLAGAGEYAFHGQLRDQNNPSGNNKLNLIKAGSGTQTLEGPGITYTGTTQVGGTGKLVLESAGNFKSTAVTVQSGATLQLLGGTTMNAVPSLSVANGGTLEVDVDGIGTYQMPVAQTLSGGGQVKGGLGVNGTVAPGDAGVGTLAVTGYCDLNFDAHVAWEVGGNWAGTPTADRITCQAYGIYSDEEAPTVIVISANALSGFTETAKTFTLVSGTEAGTGFDLTAFQVDASAFVAATGSFGTWNIQENGNNLELHYTPGTASPFQVWAASKIANAADRDALDDPDQDGLSNLIEFILDGNPASATSNNLPTVTAQGNNLVFTYTRRDDAESLNPFVEFDADLADTWTTAVHGTNCTIMVTENGTNPDTVEVTIPKGSNQKLFARLKVANP